MPRRQRAESGAQAADRHADKEDIRGSPDVYVLR